MHRLSPTLLFVCALLAFGPRPAHGFTIGSPLTRGCHERITAEALRRARELIGAPPAIAPTADEQALIDDLPFHLDPALRDLAGAALTLAVRDPDTGGNDPADEVALALIAGDPARQREHCLRRSDQREPDGTPRALADCAAFIHERAAAALDALDESGLPDAARRVELPVYLAIHGPRTRARLPVFHVEMGRALHALEDAYSHTWRTEGAERVTVVLNWVDYVERDLDEAIGGPPHSTRLDGCDESDPLRIERQERATVAATEALVAVLGPGRDKAARLRALDEVLARHLAWQPGCSVGNRFCDAPEERLRDPGCPCALGRGRGGSAPTGAGTAWCAALLLAMLSRRRLFRSARALRRLALGGGLVGAAVLLVAGSAEPADSAPAPGHPAFDGGAPDGGGREVASVPPGGALVDGGVLVLPPALSREVVETRERKRAGPRLGVTFGAGASIDRPAAAFFAGARYRLTPRWLLGADVEWNPFLSLDHGEVRAGALNLYVTAVLRFPLRFERVNLRTTGHAGMSVGLLDVYGAPRGSVGPFAALSPLGIDVDLGRGWRFVLDPVVLVLPVPHVTGLPFYYPQYRLSAAFQFGS